MTTPADPANDRWQQIDSIFREVLEVAPDERVDRLAALSEGDEELRHGVEELLESERAAADFWERSHDRLLSPLWPEISQEIEARSPSDMPAGTEPYRLIRCIARGGMGSVYLGERSDGAFEQRVAVKILRRGIDTEDVVRRFLAERRILASLDHPNIARILDGGTTADGRPFFVMEYVEGSPITEYCERHDLSLEDRLSLLATVAEAVRHAHGHLVVHRDLKPSNVLIAEDGTAKLLDFGIAKLLEDDDGGAAHTRTGMRVMTPGYASPEQVLGEPITTASDTYQLGVLLYELLTGRSPHGQGDEPTSRELERRILEDPPPAPSRVAPPAHRGRLASDLDAITLKALRKEPTARYASVDRLLADLDRFGAGLPVRASAGSRRYRLRKFAGRHRAGVAAAGALLVLLGGYAITLNVQSGRISAERDRAQFEALRAEQVTGFLLGLFEGVDPNRFDGETIDALALVEAGAERVERDLAAEPELQATMLAAIGGIYMNLARYELARPVLARALEVRRSVLPGDHPDVARDIGRLGDAVSQTSRDSARLLYEEALAMARRTPGPDHPLTARLMWSLAITLDDSTAATRGQQLVERSVEILRDHPETTPAELAEALAISAYGREPGIAIPRMTEALTIRRELFGDRHTEVASNLSDLALATEPIDPLAADTLMSEAAEILIELYGREHALTLSVLSNLAGLKRDRGAYAEAVPLYREVVALRRQLYPDLGLRLAFPLRGLGISLAGLGRGAEAEASLREALEILTGELPASHVLVVGTEAALGHSMGIQGKYEEGEPILRSAYDRLMQMSLAIDIQPLDKAKALEWIALFYEGWGRPEEAIRYRAELRAVADEAGLALYAEEP